MSRCRPIGFLLAICFVVLSWLNLSQPAFAMGGTLPPLNEPAPEFTLPSNSGDGDISLADYRGQWVVAYFYPADFTPGCTIEARRFQQDLPKYIDRNTQVLGISADDVASHTDFCDSEGLKFPLLADTNGSVSKAYGSWIYSRSVRHSFIIDPEGVLRDRFVKVSPSIHSREVLTRLDELQAA
ncbi:MAG: peroxiredoxin [Cyanobacteriota bacterium]|nr:peroxiredoxin [Cyanobacteriota bacterium]